MVNHLLNHPITNSYSSVDKIVESCQVVHISAGNFQCDNNLLPTVTRCVRTPIDLATPERVLTPSVLL